MWIENLWLLICSFKLLDGPHSLWINLLLAAAVIYGVESLMLPKPSIGEENQRQPEDRDVTENGKESFEDLQELFEEMFQSDIEAFGSTPQTMTPSSCSSSSYASCSDSSNATNKRNSSQMNAGKAKIGESYGFDAHFEGFCLGVEHPEDLWRGKGGGGIPGGAGIRRHGRKQKVSSGHDVSS